MLQIANSWKNSKELAERLAIRGLDGDALMSSVLEMDFALTKLNYGARIWKVDLRLLQKAW